MTLRVCAVIAAIVAIILFVVAALATTGPDLKDVCWGLVALAASVGFLALEGVVPTRQP